MPLSEIKNLSPKRSSPGKLGKPKPSLSLTCPPPPLIGINRRTEGFLSPALIPIPSPDGSEAQSVSGRSQSPACGVFRWSINNSGSGNVMLLSPLPWESGTKNKIPMAPHLSEFKDCFSPLPATPRKDQTEEDSVFEQMQSQYMLSRTTDDVYEVTENGEIVNTSRRTLSTKATSANSTPTPSTATTPTLTSMKN